MECSKAETFKYTVEESICSSSSIVEENDEVFVEPKGIFISTQTDVTMTEITTLATTGKPEQTSRS